MPKQEPPPATHSPLPICLPEAVLAVHRVLAERGHPAWLVGESLHGLMRGEARRAFELSTNASPAALLELFPTALPTRPAEATVTLPTPAGPVDMTQFRDGQSLKEDLDHRDFSIHAMAYDPLHGQLIDPHAGASDLKRARLRAVGSAEARLTESPLRALRAARLCATCGYRPDDALEAAMTALARALPALPALSARREIFRTLLAEQPSAGLLLLRRTGIEAALVPGVQDDAAKRVDAVPAQLPLRLAAWLRGTRPSAFLRAIRAGVERSEEVMRLLSHHPVDRAVDVQSEAAVRRLLGRLTEQEFEALFVLRESELTLCAPVGVSAAREALDLLRATMQRVRQGELEAARRPRLALGGREVMAILGCGPGRRIGRALDYLADQITTRPEDNDTERLRERLQHWAKDHPV